MSLIFHDRSESAAPQGVPFLTIERGGLFAISATAVELMQLAPGRSLLLVQDAATNTWYLYLGPKSDTDPFILRPRDPKKSKALMFASTAKAKAYYASHGLDATKVPSVRLVIQPKREVQGLALWELTASASAPVTPKEKPAAKKTPVVLASNQAEITARIRRQVQDLGGMQLSKVDNTKAVIAFGLLSNHSDLLPSIQGAVALHNKLTAHFSVSHAQ